MREVKRGDWGDRRWESEKNSEAQMERGADWGDQGLEMWTPAQKRGRGKNQREKVSKKETLVGKPIEKMGMLRRDRTRPREEGRRGEWGRPRLWTGKDLEETSQHKPGKSTPAGGREELGV